ncbi:hypothetical protein ABB02_00710 [Clostridiaceae bacterium JG1575]|nr:hypothetical protein ABB02_00710 [Clostridiaceae bacterium JG1575]
MKKGLRGLFLVLVVLPSLLFIRDARDHRMNLREVKGRRDRYALLTRIPYTMAPILSKDRLLGLSMTDPYLYEFEYLHGVQMPGRVFVGGKEKLWRRVGDRLQIAFQKEGMLVSTLHLVEVDLREKTVRPLMDPLEVEGRLSQNACAAKEGLYLCGKNKEGLVSAWRCEDQGVTALSLPEWMQGGVAPHFQAGASNLYGLPWLTKSGGETSRTVALSEHPVQETEGPLPGFLESEAGRALLKESKDLRCILWGDVLVRVQGAVADPADPTDVRVRSQADLQRQNQRGGLEHSFSLEYVQIPSLRPLKKETPLRYHLFGVRGEEEGLPVFWPQEAAYQATKTVRSFYANALAKEEKTLRDGVGYRTSTAFLQTPTAWVLALTQLLFLMAAGRILKKKEDSKE